jgi:hypothetical protein
VTIGTTQLELPRVTDILKDAGLIDTTWLTEHGRDRGSAIHLGCQFYDEHDLDEGSIDPNIVGYVEAYKKFRAESPVAEWHWIECPHQDPLGLYQGTPDRIVDVRPKAIYDVKTGCPVPATALQLAAYVNMLPDPYSYRRFAVYLKANGTYQVREYPREEYASDLRIFMSALNIYSWRKANHV